MERGNIFRFIYRMRALPSGKHWPSPPTQQDYITRSGPHATALVAVVPLVAVAVEEVAA
jgi:hypothetical protein